MSSQTPTGRPRLERRGSVAAIRFDNPPVNALNNAIREWLHDHVDALLADPQIKGVMFLAEGRCFVAGADVRELATGVRPPFLGDILRRIEQSDTCFVAALQGDAVGGGMEIALACDIRIATPTARMGLPEARLGLIPGAGGTQRLPRIVGVSTALDMMLHARIISAHDAIACGLIDEIVPAPSLEQRGWQILAQACAGTFARRVASAFDAAAIATARETRPSREAAVGAALLIEAVEAAGSADPDDGFARERELFLQALASDTARQRLSEFALRKRLGNQDNAERRGKMT